MVSQIGMPACVYATSTSAFLQRGFTMGSVQDVPTVISNELPVRHTYESDIKLGGHAISSGKGYFPVSYTIDLPDSFTIGETVSIPYSLSWQYENGTTKYEQLGLPTPDVYKVELGMLISDEFTVLDDNAVIVVGYGDRYSPHTGAMIYITTTSSEMTYNGTLNLRLDTAMYHDRDTILFLMYSDVYHFQVQRTDTGVNLVDTILLTDPYDLEQVRSSYYPPYMDDPSERYSVFYRPVNGTFTHIPEEQPSNTEPRAPEPPQENLYIPKHGRGFAFITGSLDRFLIGSSDSSIDYNEDAGGPLPVISMSRLPNIDETAIVEITYTSTMSVDVTDTEENRTWPGYTTGWRVHHGFEVVDSGGLEYETLYVNATGSTLAGYTAFTPLNVGESITYRIEVRAVNEGYSFISGIGYLETSNMMHLYLDDEETLTYSEHRVRYPEMHPVPKNTPYVRNTELLPPLTDEELKASTEYIPPSRELLTDFFVAYFAGNDPKQDIGDAMYFIQRMGSHLNFTLTDIKQILGDAGYADEDIEKIYVPYADPTRDEFWEWFVSHHTHANPRIAPIDALNFVYRAGGHLNLTATDVKQLLSDGGYEDAEIDDALSQHLSTP